MTTTKELTETNTVSKPGEEAARLTKVLDFVYRFPFNVSPVKVVETVYGRDASDSYVQSKLDLIERRGFMYWYCDLDLVNQKRVAQMMIDRYGSKLTDLLETR